MSLNLDKSAWKHVSLGDVAAASKEKVDPSAGTVERFVAGEHMDTDHLKIHRWGDATEVALGPAFHRRFRPGQVLYGSRRTYLRKVAVADFDGVCANTTFVVESRDEGALLQTFLPFVMSSEPFHAFAIAESKGSVNPYVNWSDIERYEFDLPPQDQQKRIADLLWALEAHTRQLRDQRDATSLLVRRLRDLLFESRPWSATLGEHIAGITAGRSLAAGTTPAREGTFGVLKVSAVGGEGFVASENKVLLDQTKFLPHFALRSGDLLITRANTSAYVGRPAIVDVDYPNVMLSDKTLRLEIDPEVASAPFLREFLLSSRTRTAIGEAATGTGAAMKNISQAQLRGLPMPCFGMAEQEGLLNELATTAAGVTAIDRELAALAKVRTSLLLDAFGAK